MDVEVPLMDDVTPKLATQPGTRHVQQYLASKTEPSIGNKVQATNLFASYRAWAEEAGDTGYKKLNTVDNVITFGRILRALGRKAMHVSRGKPGCTWNHYMDIEIYLHVGYCGNYNFGPFGLELRRP